ncbi:hypothetical protein PoB_004971600 [Plakobranchus ocellatus]|uniref:Uncharacterized protein n=1 Tax=Plakobranchus ocellatus TaxID=259542 RepID=A0AAV4BRW1_9GAST|nr:hypothetical protein PoB_004971600 [Plakobranchus ocellatus]
MRKILLHHFAVLDTTVTVDHIVRMRHHFAVLDTTVTVDHIVRMRKILLHHCRRSPHNEDEKDESTPLSQLPPGKGWGGRSGQVAESILLKGNDQNCERISSPDRERRRLI